MRSLLPQQCRAARGMLDWTQEQLAAVAGVSRSTVRDFEGRRRELHQTTEALLIKALEDAGVRLVFDQREPGVRLRTAWPGAHGRGPGSSAQGASGWSGTAKGMR